jgi:hypothetical protein
MGFLNLFAARRESPPAPPSPPPMAELQELVALIELCALAGASSHTALALYRLNLPNHEVSRMLLSGADLARARDGDN